MRILALPAFRNRALNPYNALLYAALRRRGATVDDVTPRALLRGRYDVLHLHWPEYLFDAPGLGRALLKAAACVLILSLLRARRTAIVWTVHNLAAHERWHPRLQTWMWRWFVGRVDATIALTAGGQRAVLARFPALRRRPSFVVPHGHYRGAYPDVVTPAEARRDLGLPPEARVLLFIGAVRPYKNVADLIAAFNRVAHPHWRLLIAGQPADAGLAAALCRLAIGDGRIRLDLGFVPRDRVQVYLRAADLVALPYAEVLNSGSALLALSFDRPVLVPDRGAMAELRAIAGEDWVRTYRGRLEPETLIAAVRWSERRPPVATGIRDKLCWDTIARRTMRAYEASRTVAQDRHRWPDARSARAPEPSGPGAD